MWAGCCVMCEQALDYSNNNKIGMCCVNTQGVIMTLFVNVAYIKILKGCLPE